MLELKRAVGETPEHNEVVCATAGMGLRTEARTPTTLLQAIKVAATEFRWIYFIPKAPLHDGYCEISEPDGGTRLLKLFACQNANEGPLIE